MQRSCCQKPTRLELVIASLQSKAGLSISQILKGDPEGWLSEMGGGRFLIAGSLHGSPLFHHHHRARLA